MRKYLPVILLLSLIILLFGACAENNNSAGSGGSEASEDSVRIDVDLASFSASMVSAAYTDIMTAPEQYIGKVIRAKGMYDPFYFDETGRYHHFITIEGPPGCCPHSLEFIRSDEHAYPDDYPLEGTMIEITGIFNVIEEAGYEIPYLAIDDIIIK